MLNAHKITTLSIEKLSVPGLQLERGAVGVGGVGGGIIHFGTKWGQDSSNINDPSPKRNLPHTQVGGCMYVCMYVYLGLCTNTAVHVNMWMCLWL